MGNGLFDGDDSNQISSGYFGDSIATTTDEGNPAIFNADGTPALAPGITAQEITDLIGIDVANAVDNGNGTFTFTLTDGSSFTIDETSFDITAQEILNLINNYTGSTLIEAAHTEAEVNVQSNWTETDAGSDAFIQNKPTIPTQYDDAMARAAVNISDDDANQLTYTDAAGTEQTFSPTGTYTDDNARAAVDISSAGEVLTFRDAAGTVQTFQGGSSIDYITSSDVPPLPQQLQASPDPDGNDVRYTMRVTNNTSADTPAFTQFRFNDVPITVQMSDNTVPAFVTRYYTCLLYTSPSPRDS